MATVELCSGSILGSGFQLCIGLAEIHVPRMWVEESDSTGPNVTTTQKHKYLYTDHSFAYLQACMLTFYPEFEVDNITDNEIVILLDLSNSMKVLTAHSMAVSVTWLHCPCMLLLRIL